MKLLKILILTGLSLFLTRCANNSKNADHQHDENQMPELNEGKKWKVNEEMMPFIKNMQRDIHDFETGEVKDYAALAVILQENTQALVATCTMEGKSHDELHKWLLPYMNLVNELAEENDAQIQEEKFTAIKNRLDLFFQYFE